MKLALHQALMWLNSKNGEVTEWEIQPEDVGIESQTLTGLESFKILLKV